MAGDYYEDNKYIKHLENQRDELQNRNADLQKANNSYLLRARAAEAKSALLEKALRETLTRHTAYNVEKIDAEISSLR